MWTLCRPLKRRKLSVSSSSTLSHLDAPLGQSLPPTLPIASEARAISWSGRKPIPSARLHAQGALKDGPAEAERRPSLRWSTRSASVASLSCRAAVEAPPIYHRSLLGRRCFTTASRAHAAVAAESEVESSLFRPTSEPPPLNEAHVPLIAQNLRSQLFPPPNSPYAPPSPSDQAVKISLDHLKANGLLCETASKKPPAPAVDFQLPRLQGPTISHHFHALGREVAEPYLTMARNFAELELPPMPEKDRWVNVSGWTRYSADGSWEAVECPSEDSEAMVFDVETLPFQGGAFPIMAVAVGKDGWYGWCSPWLTGDDDSPNHLIPFSRTSPSSLSGLPSAYHDFLSDTSTLFERSDDRPRLLIGHNVLFDRARVASEYALRRPSTRYLDTLSLHVAVSGLTNPQRPSWLKYRKDKQIAEDKAATSVKPSTSKTPSVKTVETVAKTWREVGSVNSLSEVARLHCGTKVDKSLRNVLIDPITTIEDIRQDFGDMMSYCAIDVQTTLDVYQVLLPKFLGTCPHPTSFGGILLMSQPVLPVDRHWPQYIERTETVYRERLLGVQNALKSLAEEARAKFEVQNEEGRFEWEDDVWLRQLDWSPKRARRLPGEGSPKGSTTALPSPAASELAPEPASPRSPKPQSPPAPSTPRWYERLTQPAATDISVQSPLAAALFRVTWRSFPVVFTESHGYLFAVKSSRNSFKPLAKEILVEKEELGPKDSRVQDLKGIKLYTVPASSSTGRCRTLLGRGSAQRIKDGLIGSEFPEMAEGAAIGKAGEGGTRYRPVAAKLRKLADEARNSSTEARRKSIWLQQLDWATAPHSEVTTEEAPKTPEPLVTSRGHTRSTTSVDVKQSDLYWPRWFWDLDVPGAGLEVSVRKRAVPLLLKLMWRGFPIVHSKGHGWVYRVPRDQLATFLESDPSLHALKFTEVADVDLSDDAPNAAYFKMPHPDGESKNVGSPLSKPFVSAFEDGILTSEYPIAKAALALNASCSYWTSARERIVNQMVVWEGGAKAPAPTPAAVDAQEVSAGSQGLILPQVIPMGTVTRRAVEKTWLTASNAKKNRVGSELKSMIRAPPGYAIVGADVDSEELWICSVMGDAQFGIHGATAIGWMTLEGTKSAGTDLHSKSASILGISRDDAKVFNYSRIYGAGVKHAVQLLTKSNPTLSTEQATKLAKNLYASTKGVVDRSRAFDRHFWHGGTESFVFNKLEQIAQSDRPRTPALGCGLTDALTKCFLPAEGQSAAGQGFMPSRINWVVQSSGVDYLHLLLVAMEYLTKRFEIDARYMISVHDEVRYLVKEQDKYRAAMAMQVANIWTRSLFAYRLQMPDLPQGCAFFSAVDVDTCFRKEVNMTCVTPSNPDSIPFGESLTIDDSLRLTHHGSLFPDGRPMSHEASLPALPPLPRPLTAYEVQGDQHRVAETNFLVAQTSSSAREIQRLWKETQDQPTEAVPKRLGAVKAGRSERQREEEEFMRAAEEYLAASRSKPASPLKTGRITVKAAEVKAQQQGQHEHEHEYEFDPEIAPEMEEDFSHYEPLKRSQV